MISLFSRSLPPDAAGRDFTVHLYEEHKALMYATAQKYMADPHAAEDIVQDSVVKLLQKVDFLQQMDPCRLAGYVVATVRNTAINHLKRQGVADKHAAQEDDLSELPTPELPLEDMVILAEQSRTLVSIWPQLTPEEQRLLEGKYILGYTDAELCQDFGCKPESIRMKLTRARRKALRLILEAKGDEVP